MLKSENYSSLHTLAYCSSKTRGNSLTNELFVLSPPTLWCISRDADLFWDPNTQAPFAALVHLPYNSLVPQTFSSYIQIPIMFPFLFTKHHSPTRSHSISMNITRSTTEMPDIQKNLYYTEFQTLIQTDFQRYRIF